MSEEENKIELEDLDYSPDVIGQYITRYGDTKLLTQERLYRALAKHNEGVDENVIRDAADKSVAFKPFSVSFIGMEISYALSNHFRRSYYCIISSGNFDVSKLFKRRDAVL